MAIGLAIKRLFWYKSQLFFSTEFKALFFRAFLVRERQK
jgi:hypothetical protein